MQKYQCSPCHVIYGWRYLKLPTRMGSRTASSTRRISTEALGWVITKDLALGRVYTSQGRVTEALEVFRSGFAIIGHDGFMPGYLTSMGWFPDARIAVALQVNTDDARALGRAPTAVLVELAQLATDDS